VNPERAALGGAAPGRPLQKAQRGGRCATPTGGLLSANGELPMSSHRGSAINPQAICYEVRPSLGLLPTTTRIVEGRMDDGIEAVQGVLLGALTGALFWIAMYVAIVIL
jgi:hypothetical protein